MLFEFGSIEPKDQEIILILFYEKGGEIKWAFKNPEAISGEIKETVRKNYPGS